MADNDQELQRLLAFSDETLDRLAEALATKLAARRMAVPPCQTADSHNRYVSVLTRPPRRAQFVV